MRQADVDPPRVPVEPEARPPIDARVAHLLFAPDPQFVGGAQVGQQAIPVQRNHRVGKIAERQGTLLVGTGEGLYRHDVASGTFTPVPGTEGLDVYAVVPFPDGTVWIGTLTGPWVLHGGRAVRAAAGRVPDVPVRAFHRDAAGVTWVGTYGRGVYRLAGEEVVRIGTQPADEGSH